MGLYSESTLIYLLSSGLYCLVSEIRTLSCVVQGKQPGREETRVSYRMSKRVMSLHSGGFLLTEECAIMRVFCVFFFIASGLHYCLNCQLHVLQHEFMLFANSKSRFREFILRKEESDHVAWNLCCPLSPLLFLIFVLMIFNEDLIYWM